MLIQSCINAVQRCFDIVSTLGTDVVSTLRNVENPTSGFVSFSTSDQRYFNVDPQRSNNVDPTSKCWLGCFAFTKNPIILRLFKTDTLNFTMYISTILTYPLKSYRIGLHNLILINIFFSIKIIVFFYNCKESAENI